MSRQYVHLSGDWDTAAAVGKRHGIPVVLTVDARAMAEDGILFYRSENGVWLCEEVAPRSFCFPREFLAYGPVMNVGTRFIVSAVLVQY